jgi:hypothetical protein
MIKKGNSGKPFRTSHLCQRNHAAHSSKLQMTVTARQAENPQAHQNDLKARDEQEDVAAFAPSRALF